MRDAIIIGGGIAGLSLAAQLAPHMSVTVLEAERALAYHASGRSAAAYVPGYGNDVIQVLTDASRDALDAAGVLSPRGFMLFARPGEEDAFAREAGEFSLTEIGFDEAVARVPILRRDSISRIGTKDDVWDLDTDALVQGFARDARAAGCQIVTSAPVTEIERFDTGWRVTAGDVHEAKLLINAAGAWADTIAQMAGIAPLNIQPHRRSVARVALPEGVDPTHWPLLDGVNERWYAKPDAGALIVSPADEEPIVAQDAWAEEETLASGIARYEEMVTSPVTRMLANWAGLRSFAPDRTPVLGRDSRDSSFIWCAGQGGYGFQTTPGAALFLAGILLERPTDIGPEITAALSPRRFG